MAIEQTKYHFVALCADAIWVHGNLKTSPGVQGFVNSARKEPKGDRVYGILSWDTDATPQELVEHASRLQLANNCFKHGRHGAYISVDTDVRAALPLHSHPYLSLHPNAFRTCYRLHDI